MEAASHRAQGNPDLPLGLDHIAHAVRDLDAGAELYRRLGFTVGARNRHPWGTHNRIVQLPGFFVELLTMAEPERLGGDAMSLLFGNFHRIFLQTHEGLSFLVLESADANADVARLEASGIAQSGAVHFRREGRRPDGTPVTVAFSLAFAKAADADAEFAVCQQHFPENFWNPQFQTHANGVTGIGGVVLVSDDPNARAAFLRAFVGKRDLDMRQDSVSAQTARGRIDIVTPERFAREFGVDPSGPPGMLRLAALRFVTRDLAAAAGSLTAGGIAARSLNGRLVVPPQIAHGAVIAFEAQPA
ncbi:MAG: VOC family protein [Pseudorhodoplanes sp.]|nr:VOC family protein [Pseudorhodoplanes sp.]